MKTSKILVLFCVMVFGMLSCACIFSPPNASLKVSGYVYCDNQPLEETLIKSSTQKLCYTDEYGHFEFQTSKSHITIFAEKDGYMFLPDSAEIYSSTNNITFTAQKIVPLNGSLSLSKINITPISIVSLADNFQFVENSNVCLKVKSFNVEINGKIYNCLNQDLYAIKNKSNYIDFNNDFSIDTGEQYSIKFTLDAYFTSNHHEYVFVEEKQTILNVSQVQTNANLNENMQIEFSSWGVNSSNNKFSYNVTFIFDYFPAL